MKLNESDIQAYFQEARKIKGSFQDLMMALDRAGQVELSPAAMKALKLIQKEIDRIRT